MARSLQKCRTRGKDLTEDPDDLAAGRALTYFDAAYKIARTMVVAAARKTRSNKLI